MIHAVLKDSVGLIRRQDPHQYFWHSPQYSDVAPTTRRVRIYHCVIARPHSATRNAARNAARMSEAYRMVFLSKPVQTYPGTVA